MDRFKGTRGKPEAERAAPARPAQSPVEPEPEGFEIVEVAPAEFGAELEAGDEVVVVDTRQPWDYQALHIPGAVSIPLSQLPARYNELAPDDNIVLYCYHGFTSQDGAAFLMQHGYKRVRSLTGGFTQWAGEGRPTERE
ncbi:MAG TPA: rhodanese-like domain-containing protein [Lacipirellulaceae bacterium]|nr:rhodanese-like domain-containing protein [Lacipirellulaceae bacterium]